MGGIFNALQMGLRSSGSLGRTYSTLRNVMPNSGTVVAATQRMAFTARERNSIIGFFPSPGAAVQGEPQASSTPLTIRLHAVNASAQPVLYVNPNSQIGMPASNKIFLIGMPAEEVLKIIEEKSKLNPPPEIVIVSGEDWIQKIRKPESDPLSIGDHSWGQAVSDLTPAMKKFLLQRFPEKYDSDRSLNQTYPIINEMSEYKDTVQQQLEKLAQENPKTLTFYKNNAHKIDSRENGDVVVLDQDGKTIVQIEKEDLTESDFYIKSIKPRNIQGFKVFSVPDLCSKEFNGAIELVKSSKKPIVMFGSGPTGQWVYTLMKAAGSGISDSKVIVPLPEGWDKPVRLSVKEYLNNSCINFNRSRVERMIADYEKGNLVFCSNYKCNDDDTISYDMIKSDGSTVGVENEEIGFTLNFTGSETIPIASQLQNEGVPEYRINDLQAFDVAVKKVSLPEHCPVGSMPWYAAWFSSFLPAHPTVYSLFNEESAKQMSNSFVGGGESSTDEGYMNKFPFDPDIFSGILNDEVQKSIAKKGQNEISNIPEEKDVIGIFDNAYKRYLDEEERYGPIDEKQKTEVSKRFNEQIVVPLVSQMFRLPEYFDFLKGNETNRLRPSSDA